jgi:ribosomal protein S18 acetylase RimI-like enzyme
LDAVLDVYRHSEDFLALGPTATASLAMVLDDIDLAKREGGVFCGIYAADNTMVGVVEYIASPFNGDPHCACLCLLMIARDHRNRGIGQAVLSAVETELRSDPQVSAIVAGVQVNNPRALAFWQRYGYRIVSGPEVRPDQTTVLGLRKDFPSHATGGK